MQAGRVVIHTRGTRGAIAGLAIALVTLAAVAQAASTGVTSLGFEQSVLFDLGIEVEAEGSAPPAHPGEVGFAIVDASSLRLAGPSGDFEGFAGGVLHHTGSLALRFGGQRHSLAGFELRAAGGVGELALFDAAGRRWLLLENPQPLLRGGELLLDNLDVTAAPELAAALGRPELDGTYLGTAHLRVPAAVLAFAAEGSPAALLGPCDPVFTADRDVALMEVGPVSQLARVAAGPVALTFSARLRNVGTSAVEWKNAILPDAAPADVGEHPFLALHLYRIAGGRIVQIGRSDVKHAFFATNTGCVCAGGHVIYPDCEDTYSASTNSNRLYFAPREEVAATTGAWESLGSHFDATPADDFRDHGGEPDHDAFEHRLLVDESELQAGGSYFVEAWYLIAGDVDLFNSMGHDPVSASFSGSTWFFSTLGAITNGSILDEFVDPTSPPPGSANEVLDTGEGRLQLAVSTTALGGGLFHYEYALMNFDFDRQIRSFTLPLVPSVAVADADFRDADVAGANDWGIEVGPYAITWTAPAGNALDWGTLYSFGFDANAAPVATTAGLGVLEPDAPSALQAATLGPTGGAAIPAHTPSSWLALALLVAAGFGVRRRRFRLPARRRAALRPPS